LRGWGLLLWIAVIVGVVVPWTSYQPHSHWSRIVWVPFSTPPPITFRDVAGNVLLYVPFGLLWPRGRGFGLRALFWCLCCAAALAGVTELSQVYSHGRFPSSTDALLNLAGAWLGAAFRRRLP